VTGRRGDWVCLIYHELVDAVPARRGDREWFAVPVHGFSRQLDLIRAAGLTAGSVARALAPDGPRVAISFDDGLRSDYERAFPALAERGMTATFFVVTDRVGTAGYVTWGELREMRAAGMSIQSHTRSHPFLSELAPGALRNELAGSKAALDDALDQDTDQLALPGGDAPRGRLRDLMTEAGYRVVATSRWGVNHQGRAGVPTMVRRCTVMGDPDAERFRRVVDGHWLVGLRRRVREGVLGNLRAVVGPSRYATWRRRLLDAAHRPGAGR